MAAVVVLSKTLSLDLRVNVKTEVLCQICEWVLELRVCAGLTLRPLRCVVLISEAIPAAAAGTGLPHAVGSAGPLRMLVLHRMDGALILNPSHHDP